MSLWKYNLFYYTKKRRERQQRSEDRSFPLDRCENKQSIMLFVCGNHAERYDTFFEIVSKSSCCH